ncbi:hypothetical protein [Streptomyces sp. NPDC089799]|uniref:hypothetical protein n=1 Tax=Streptomyces sp. NPDC089799 TaxID=3155066 RepID=UPI003425B2E7
MNELEHLWTSPPGTYILARVSVEGKEVLLPLNVIESKTTVIDDDSLQEEVTRRMIAAGVQIVDYPTKN